MIIIIIINLLRILRKLHGDVIVVALQDGK